MEKGSIIYLTKESREAREGLKRRGTKWKR